MYGDKMSFTFDFGLWLVKNIGCIDKYGNPIESVVPCKQWNLTWVVVFLLLIVVLYYYRKKIKKMF